MVKNSEIRTVDELEKIRVDISEEIEQLLKTGKDTKTLDRIKALRQQGLEVKDELALAKNIEAARAKDNRIAEIRNTEAKTGEQMSIMLDSINQLLPKFKEIEPLLTALSSANGQRVALNMQLDGSLERYRNAYNETIEVKKPMVAVVEMVDVATLKDCISRLLHQWDSPTDSTIKI